MSANDKLHNQSGFSLIELLIVIIIFSIIMAAIMTMLNSSLQVSNASTQLTDAQQNLRTGQEYLTRDLYNAADNLVEIQPMVLNDFANTFLAVPANSVNNNGNFPVPNNTFKFTGMIMSDLQPAGTEASPTTVMVRNPSEPGLRVKPGTDRITILTTPDPDNAFPDINTLLSGGGDTNEDNRIFVASADAARVQLNEIYLLMNNESPTAPSSAAFVEVTNKGTNFIEFGTSGDLYDLNRNDLVEDIVANDNEEARLILRRVWMVHYFVDSNDRLIRRVFGQRSVAHPGFTEYVIAENVNNLRFDYIYLDPVTLEVTMVRELDTVEELARVRQIRVGLETETSRPVINNENKTVSNYTLISPRNLQFRRALQP
jgi:prepilin-type N-terminal cleavage/methylation domain-containing protein